MKIIIAGGTGFIGRYLVEQYLKKQQDVTVIGRSRAKINKIFPKQVTAVDWNTLRQTGLDLLQGKDLVINLNGANIASKRWTTSRKQELLNSRLMPTELLSALCAKLKNHSPALFNASAVSIYGTQEATTQQLPSKLTENSTIQFDPKIFSQNLVKRWEAATAVAREAGVHVINMRFGVVLGQSGGMLAHMRLPFLLGLGGKIGSGRQPFSWITLPDLARAIDFLMKHPEINGAINFTSPGSTTQKAFAKKLGAALKRPAFLPMPTLIAHLLFGEMGDELMLKGQNVYPEALLTHGFEFEHPELSEALNYTLK